MKRFTLVLAAILGMAALGCEPSGERLPDQAQDEDDDDDPLLEWYMSPINPIGPFSPLNPASPLSPLNPASPLSPLNN